MPSTGRKKWLAYGLVIAVLLAGVGTVLYLWWDSVPPKDPPQRSFSGSSEDLRRTVVVPTLDTPIPEGKCAVWCSSFQIAWNQMKGIANGPIQLRNAEAIAERLNRAQQSEADLGPDMYYAAAGAVADGILEKIQQDMSQRYPAYRLPEFANPQRVLAAFAYIEAGVKYESPFSDNPEWLRFTDSVGKQTKVRSFGIHRHGSGGGSRRQVNVLFNGYKEFALDLSKNTQPNQIVLAKVNRKETLSATLAHVLERQTRAPESLGDDDTLLVPNMDWRAEHHFRDMEGPDKVIENLSGLYLGTAFQSIQFKLDRTGAEIKSEAWLISDNGRPNHYHFDRPFLIYLKKRDAKHPFFVMWVDNAELLCKR